MSTIFTSLPSSREVFPHDSSKRPPISLLPQELLFTIFSKLPFKDVQSLRIVCQEFKGIIDDDRFWKVLCFDHFDKFTLNTSPGWIKIYQLLFKNIVSLKEEKKTIFDIKFDIENATLTTLFYSPRMMLGVVEETGDKEHSAYLKLHIFEQREDFKIIKTLDLTSNLKIPSILNAPYLILNEQYLSCMWDNCIQLWDWNSNKLMVNKSSGKDCQLESFVSYKFCFLQNSVFYYIKETVKNSETVFSLHICCLFNGDIQREDVVDISHLSPLTYYNDIQKWVLTASDQELIVGTKSNKKINLLYYTYESNEWKFVKLLDFAFSSFKDYPYSIFMKWKKIFVARTNSIYIVDLAKRINGIKSLSKRDYLWPAKKRWGEDLTHFDRQHIELNNIEIVENNLSITFCFDSRIVIKNFSLLEIPQS